MSTPQGNPLWQEHLERLARLYGQSPPATALTGRRSLMSDRDAEDARRGEWTATPPGRLGRRLLADIEPYLEFFAIARADAVVASDASRDGLPPAWPARGSR